MPRNVTKPKKEDTNQANIILASFSIIGLTLCFYFANAEGKDVPLVLYAIFGGGILGTDNVLKMLKTIFRVDK